MYDITKKNELIKQQFGLKRYFFKGFAKIMFKGARSGLFEENTIVIKIN